MLVSSLLRTYFGGDIIVFRNSPEPLFRVERKGLEEIYIETPQLGGLVGAEDAWCWKYRVREYIDAEKYDKSSFWTQTVSPYGTWITCWRETGIWPTRRRRG